jgi:signal peptidase I
VETAKRSEIPRKVERVKKKSTVREYVEGVLWAVVLALLIRTFLFQAFRIPSSSMEDTLLVGDYLFVSKFLYGAEIPFTGGVRLPAIRQPERGDIIVFRYPDDPSVDFIKRCVAVEGDTLLFRDETLYINGEAQVEPFTKYVDGGRRFKPGMDAVGPLVVPPGHLFMMGDNRDRSSDSRVWGFLDKDLIRGKALFIYWSWDGERNLPRFSRILDLVR